MRWRSDRGQVSVEWVGVLALVGLVVAVLWAAGLGGKVTGELGTAVCRIFGGECGSSPAERASEPQIPCVTSDSDGRLRASVTVFSVKGGGELRLLRQQRSDGTVMLTASGGGQLGAEFGIGGGGSVDTGQGSVGAAARAKGGVNAQGEGGASWVLPDAAAADELTDILRNRARDGAIEAAAPGVGWLGVQLFGEDRPVPDPDITYVQGGVGGSAKGEVGAAVGFAEASAEGAVLLGTRTDNRTGESTTYLRLKGTGRGSAGALVGVDGQADLDGQLAITYDRDGRPVRASVIGLAGVAGGADDLNALLSNTAEESPQEWLRKVKLVGQEQDGARLEFQYDLDLRDPAVGAALQGFLDDPVGGADELGRQLVDNGQFNARAYTFDRSRYGGGADAALGIKFGLEGSYEGVDSQLVGAWYADGGSGGLREWTTCTAAAQ
jgi:hypothetical protein